MSERATETKRQRRPEAARRIENRRQRKRDAILDAARQTLDERGPHDISLRAVARAAGCAPATMYEYFDSLFALLDALAERAREELRQRLNAATADSTGMASDLMVRLAFAYVRFARQQPKAFRLIFETLAPKQDDQRPTFELHPVMGPLLGAVRTGQLSGEIHAQDDPSHIAWGLWALAHGLATLRASSANVTAAHTDVADISVLQAYVRGWLA